MSTIAPTITNQKVLRCNILLVFLGQKEQKTVTSTCIINMKVHQKRESPSSDSGFNFTSF